MALGLKIWWASRNAGGIISPPAPTPGSAIPDEILTSAEKKKGKHYQSTNFKKIELDTLQKMLTKEEHYQKLLIIKGFHATNEHEHAFTANIVVIFPLRSSKNI